MTEHAKHDKGEKPRIGVFVCHCGSNIGGFVDVPSAAEYAKTLPDVVYATDNLYTCAEDGLNSIREGIRKHNLNRVIVAICTPRTHAPLFQATCESAGLNKYLFTFVNIREHCSWVHMKEKDEGHSEGQGPDQHGRREGEAPACPRKRRRSRSTPVGLVIGGGVAGMTAALSLADMGFPVHLVERDGDLGGFVKIPEQPLRHGQERRGYDQAAHREGHEGSKNIKLHLNSHVKSVEGFIGNYDIVIGSEGRRGHQGQGRDHRGRDRRARVRARGAVRLQPVPERGHADGVRDTLQEEEPAEAEERGVHPVRRVQGPEDVVLLQDLLQRVRSRTPSTSWTTTRTCSGSWPRSRARS